MSAALMEKVKNEILKENTFSLTSICGTEVIRPNFTKAKITRSL